MSSSALPDVEPFSDSLSLRVSGRSNEMLRFGYRVAGTETVLAAIEVPLSVVQQSIPREVSARLSQDGTIVASLDLGGFGGRNDIKEIPLVQLVKELLEPHHLFMEETKASGLEPLLRSLESSIQLVRTTISTLTANDEPTTVA